MSTLSYSESVHKVQTQECFHSTEKFISVSPQTVTLNWPVRPCGYSTRFVHLVPALLSSTPAVCAQAVWPPAASLGPRWGTGDLATLTPHSQELQTHTDAAVLYCRGFCLFMGHCTNTSQLQPHATFISSMQLCTYIVTWCWKGFMAHTPIMRTSTWHLFNWDQVCWRACFILKARISCELLNTS